MQNKPANQVNAGFFVRLAAYLVDSLIVGAALLLIRIPIGISSIVNPDNLIVRDFIFSYSIADIVLYVLTAAYFIILTYETGATIGKKVFHLRVVSTEDRKLTLFEVAFRETVGRFLSALIVNVGYFLIGVSKEKHGLHDMLSDTEVIYCHKKEKEVEAPIVVQETASLTNYAPASYASPTDYMPESYASPTDYMPASYANPTDNTSTDYVSAAEAEEVEETIVIEKQIEETIVTED